MISSLLRLLPAKLSHYVALSALRFKIPKGRKPPSYDNLNTKLLDSLLLHPIGLAAGFDKNAIAIEGLEKLHYSFLEIGTVTLDAQGPVDGHHITRDKNHKALYNRLGLPNDGADKILSRLDSISSPLPLLINISMNRHSNNLNELKYIINNFKHYICVINISCPNVKEEHSPEDIIEYLSTLNNKGRILFKLSPDIDKVEFQHLVSRITDHKFGGLVLTNTHKTERGGLSGAPLFQQATRCLEWAWEIHQGKLFMIGCGGILSGYDIMEKIIRGASCVEIYTAITCRGVNVVADLLEELDQEIKTRGFKSLEEACGSYYSRLQRKGS